MDELLWPVGMVSGDDDVMELLETLVELSDDFSGCGEDDAPEALLVDVSDDDLAGFAVLRQLRRRFPGSDVVAFSPLPDPVSLLSAIDAGADAYLATSQLWNELIPTLKALRALRSGVTDWSGSQLAMPRQGR